MNSVDRLNFCSQAIPDLMRFAYGAEKQGYARTAELVRHAVSMLYSAVKFILPDGGRLFDFQGVNQTHLDLLKLPYPVIAAEFRAVKNTEEDKSAYLSERVPKRIALAFNVDDEVGGQYVSILPINFIRNSWIPNWCYQVFQADSKVCPYPEGYKFLKSEIKKAGFKVPKMGVPGHMGLLGEAGQLIWGDNVNRGRSAEVAAMLDVRDEVVAIMQLCGALNCANVKAENISAPKNINAKRAKAGKPPLFSYKVLKVETPTKYTSGPFQGGTHASPRVHLRRGHIRRLPDKMVWVQPCVVGEKSRGMVVKDYAVS